MDSDGTNVVQLTNDASTHRSPAFSPDGSQIAFWSNRDGFQNIYVMDADGSNLRQLTHEGSNFDPSWSPDGSRMVFVSSSDGQPRVYTMDPDGNNVTSLEAITRFSQPRPVFSPDGTKIAFGSTGDDFLGNVSIMNADGSGLEILTLRPFAGYYPVWSPDGTTIAFQGSPDPRSGLPYRVYLMDLKTRTPTQLTDFSAEPHAWAWFPAGDLAARALLRCPCRQRSSLAAKKDFRMEFTTTNATTKVVLHLDQAPFGGNVTSLSPGQKQLAPKDETDVR